MANCSAGCSCSFPSPSSSSSSLLGRATSANRQQTKTTPAERSARKRVRRPSARFTAFAAQAGGQQVAPGEPNNANWPLARGLWPSLCASVSTWPSALSDHYGATGPSIITSARRSFFPSGRPLPVVAPQPQINRAHRARAGLGAGQRERERERERSLFASSTTPSCVSAVRSSNRRTGRPEERASEARQSIRATPTRRPLK